MARPASFSFLDKKFDRFLFASIGSEANDMPLTVASALARLGSDPWTEAERLAKLPRQLAAEALVAMILKASPVRTKAADAPDIADRLVMLLPGGGEVSPQGSSSPVAPASGRFAMVLLLLGLAYVAFVAFDLISDRRPSLTAPATIEEPQSR